MHIRYCLIITLIASLTLSACHGVPDSSTTSRDVFDPDPEDTIGSIVGYNHTGEYIHEFYVDGVMGSNIFAYSGGGGFTCCGTFPRQWREDLKITVEWSTSPSEITADARTHWHKKSVPLKKYGPDGGMMHVHFLPDLAVIVVISNLYVGSPDYPGPKPPRKNTQ